MTAERDRTLIVHFTDGTKLVFTFPRQADRHSVSAKLEELLKHDQLTIEADGTVILIPLTSVKYAQVLPAPGALSGSVIRGARIES